MTAMNAKQNDFFALCATVCSTFVPINKGTSMRSPTSPLGNQEQPSVQLGNILASRTQGTKQHCDFCLLAYRSELLLRSLAPIRRHVRMSI